MSKCILPKNKEEFFDDIRTSIAVHTLFQDATPEEMQEEVIQQVIDNVVIENQREQIDAILAGEDNQLNAIISEALTVANSMMLESGIKVNTSSRAQLGMIEKSLTTLRDALDATAGSASSSNNDTSNNTSEEAGKDLGNGKADGSRESGDGPIGNADVNPDDTDTTRDSNYTLNEALAPSEIVIPQGSRDMSDVFNSYFDGDMAKHSGEVVEFFQYTLNSNWLSTDKDNVGSFSFDEKVIVDNMRKTSTGIITDYYEKKLPYAKGSTIISEDENVSSDVYNALFYDSIEKIPADSIYKGEKTLGDGTIAKVFEGTSKNFSSNTLLYVTDTVKEDYDLQEWLDAEAYIDGENAAISNLFSEIVQQEHLENSVRVDRNTILSHTDNQDMRTVYMAQTMLNEMDSFIQAFAPMLDSTYIVKLRTGHDQIDVIGSDMASKLLKLTFVSTPMFYNSDELISAEAKLKEIEKSIKGPETTASLVKSLLLSATSTKSKMFTGTDTIGNSTTGILLNLGNFEALLTYGDYLDPLRKGVTKRGWFYKTSDGKIITKNNVLTSLQAMNASDQFTAILRKALITFDKSVTEDVIDTLKDDGSVNYTSNMFGLTDLISTVNNVHEVSKSTKLTVAEGNERFLTEPELEIASAMLQDIPRDIDEAGEFLKKKMEKDKNPSFRNVARALYYRFFNPQPYYVSEINPITGLIERKQHFSLYYQSMKMDNDVAKQAVHAALSHISSVAIDNKLLYENGYTNVTSVQNKSDYFSSMKNLDLVKTEHTNGKTAVSKSVTDNFEVRSEGNKILVDYYRSPSSKGRTVPDVTLTMTPSTVLDKTYTVTSDVDLSLYELKQIGSTVGIPASMFESGFHDTIRELLPRVQGDILSFYGTMIALKLANAGDSKSYVYNQFTQFSSSGDEYIRFPANVNMMAFKDVVIDALQRTSGRHVRARLKGADGADYSASVIRNLSKELGKEVINARKKSEENPNYLYTENKFVNGVYRFTDNEITLGGMRLGSDGKPNKSLDGAEKMRVLIDGAFLHKGRESKWKETFIQPGPMSDRSKVGVRGVAFVKGDMEVLPELNGDLDRGKLRDEWHEQFQSTYLHQGTAVVSEWKNFLTKVADGEINLETTNSPITQKLVNSITTLNGLYSTLKQLGLDYNEVMKKSGMTEGFFVARGSDAHGNKGKAIIKPAFVQLHQMAAETNPYFRNMFLDMHIRQFNQYLDSIDYKPSLNSLNTIIDKFGLKQTMGEQAAMTKATEILRDGYFFHASILEQQIMQVANGDVWAFGNKAPKTILESSFFEQFIGAEDFIKQQKDPVKTTLEIIENTKLPNGKTLKQMSLKEINKLGANYNRAKIMKAILTSPSLNNKAKLNLLYFDDVFTQVSPMYVDRVKRNQALGTSGYSYVFAKKGKPGFLLDESSKTMLIRDPEKTVYTMGSGEADIETYNGSMFVSASYLYKHNNSLGNKMSNFRGRGPLKTVNASKDEHGNSVYEKLAVFPMFTWEHMLYATPEHEAIARTTMTAVNFEEYEGIGDTVNRFNGMWLPADPLNPNLGDWKAIPAEEVLRHGDYLGKVLVTNPEGDTEERTVSDILFDLRTGVVTEEELLYNTYETKLEKVDNIHNKYDLYNYYNGIQGNLDKMLQTEEGAQRKAFKDEFPYGWVEWQVANIMSNYRGINGDYPIRNAEINKVVFQTAVKNGAKNVNDPDVIYKENLRPEDIVWHEVSNENLGTVLYPEHDPDTTGEWSTDAEIHNNVITMMTQVFSAATAQGETLGHVAALFGALGDMANNQLQKLDRELQALTDLEKRKPNERDRADANKIFIIGTVREAMRKRKDPGITKALADMDPTEVSLDLKMLVALARSSVNAEIERRTIKLKAKGGQFILAPIDNQMRTYTYGRSSGLLRASHNPDRTSTNRFTTDGKAVTSIKKDNSINGLLYVDINNRSYEEAMESLPDGWTLTAVKSRSALNRHHTVNDYIYVLEDDGKFVSYTVAALQQHPALETYLKQGKIYSPWVARNGTMVSEDGTPAVQATSLADTFYEVSKGTQLFILNQETGMLQDADGYTDEALSDAFDQGILYIKDKGGNQKGDTLKWIDYTQNGVKLQDMDTFKSFKAAGMLPTALKEIDKTISDPFTKEELLLKTISEAPDGVLARFYQEEVEGNFVPALGPVTIEESAAIVRANDALLQQAIDWIMNTGNVSKFEFTDKFRFELSRHLEQDNWHYKPSEFFMPPMHQTAFLIDDGDNVQDIVGTQEQPDFTTLFSLTIPQGNRQIKILSEKERHILETGWDTKRGRELQSKLKAVANDENVPEEARAIVTEFINNRVAQQQRMIEYFATKIDKIEALADKDTLTELEKKGLRKRAPLLLLRRIADNTKGANLSTKLNAEIDTMLKDSTVISNAALIDTLLEFKEHINNNKPNKIKSELDRKINIFKSNWATDLANNFEKSLTFITARIPAQAKQSATVGKVKNFIFSTRNTIYAPLELFAITGADYDIDKQNNITWDVDSSGRIIDWSDFVGVETDLEASELHGEKNVIDIQLSKFEDKLALQLEQLGQRLTDLGYSDSKIESMKVKFELAQRESMTKAVQNFILHKLMAVYGDSKNAIESSVMVIMNQLGVIKDFMDSFQIDEETLKKHKIELTKEGKIKSISPALLELLEKRQYANPYSPSSTAIYEKLNMDGKTGVAIYASALKAYFASYYAWLNNNDVVQYNKNLLKLTGQALDNIVWTDTGEVDLKRTPKQVADLIDPSKLAKREGSEGEYIRFKPDEEQVEEALSAGIKVRKDAFHFVYKNPETGLFEIKTDIDTLANTRKHMPYSGNVYGKLGSVEAKRAYRQLVIAGDPEKEAAIIKKYMTQFKLTEGFDKEPQAWRDLSDLLSAATDNAKELILGAIGSNNTTSSIISTMVMLGIDLKTALPVINDPEIQATVKEFEKSRRLIKEDREDIPESFKAKLLAKAEEYRLTSKLKKQAMSDEAIEEAVINAFKSKGEPYTEEEVKKEIERQKKLRKLYNPARQIWQMAKAADELSALAGILKINTGMVNGELDTLNYLRKINQALGGKFTVEDFIKAVEEKDSNPEALIKILKAAEKNKTMFNIPYILYKNQYYLSYIKSLTKANEMMEASSFKVRILRNNIAKNLPWNVSRLSDVEFRDFMDTLDNMLINKFYKEKQNKEFSVGSFTSKYGGSTYDLSKPMIDTTTGDLIPGRIEFVKEVPNIIDHITQNNPELADNALLEAIKRGRVVVDKANGDRVVLLSGINTRYLDVGKIQHYKFQLKQLKNSNNSDLRLLYDVLFNYSLIVDKGGLNFNSISSLFPANEFDDYRRFLLHVDNTGMMENWFNSLQKDDPIISILMPLMAKEVSTKSDATTKNKKIIGRTRAGLRAKVAAEARAAEAAQEGEIPEVQTDQYQDNRFEEEQDDMYAMAMMEEQSHNHGMRDTNKYRKMKAKMYNVEALNEIYNNPNFNSIKVIKSATNGLLYLYNTTKKLDSVASNSKSKKRKSKIADLGYIPIQKISEIPLGTIDIDYNNIDLQKDLRKLGYDWGWEINLDSEIKGRLLSYDNDSKNYWILDENRNLTLMSESEITTYNPHLELIENAINYRPGRYLNNAEKKYYVSKNDGATLNDVFSSKTKTVTVTNIDSRKILRASAPPLLDAKLIERINKKSTRGGVPLDVYYDDVTFNAVRELMLFNTIRKLSSASKSTALEMVYDGSYQNNDAYNAVNEFLTETIQPNNGKRYKFLRMNNADKLDYIFDKLGLKPTTNIKNISRIDEQMVNPTRAKLYEGISKLTTGKFTASDKEFLTDTQKHKGLSTAEYIEFLEEKTGLDPIDYLNSVKGDILRIDNKIYFSQAVLDDSKTNTKMQKDVALKMPFKVRRTKLKHLSPKVMTKLGVFLNKRFNNTVVKSLNTAEIRSRYGEKFAKANAFVYNGIVVINVDKATVETMMHEMGHLYLAQIKDTDQATYEALMSKLKGDPDLEEMANKYPELSEIDLLEELFVEKLAHYNSGVLQAQLENELESSGKDYGKVTEAFETMFGDFLGTNLNGELDLNDSLITIFAKIGRDIVFNNNSMLNSFTKSERSDLMRIVDPFSMTDNELIKFMQKKGFIQIKC
jgi:hypothetical protein